mgnify:CR=1 FL=1
MASTIKLNIRTSTADRFYSARHTRQGLIWPVRLHEKGKPVSGGGVALLVDRYVYPERAIQAIKRSFHGTDTG